MNGSAQSLFPSQTWCCSFQALGPLHFLLSDLSVVLVCVSVLCLNEGSSAQEAPAPYRPARKPFPRVYQQSQALKPAFSSFGRKQRKWSFLFPSSPQFIFSGTIC